MSDKSPQQKKKLSYEKDRRNAYGQHDKASRRLIPAQKAAAEKGNRKAAKQALYAPETLSDEERQEEADALLNGKKLNRWDKSPDATLGKYVEGRLKRRAAFDLKFKKK